MVFFRFLVISIHSLHDFQYLGDFSVSVSHLTFVWMACTDARFWRESNNLGKILRKKRSGATSGSLPTSHPRFTVHKSARRKTRSFSEISTYE